MRRIKALLIFIVHFCCQMTNLGILSVIVFVIGCLRFLLPVPALSRLILHFMHKLYFVFAINSVALIKFFNSVEIDINIDQTLSKQKWYLITANHLSYLDIILLIEFCAKRIPPPKFFLKKELIWLPFVGIAAWAMDMPFMRRYSKEFVEKNPHLKGKDIETTRESCKKYKDFPTTVINFVEGTRFTPSKKISRKSPFEYLLRPKAGGIAFTLSAMGELFSNILDITLIYPNSKSPMVDMLSGNMKHIIIDVKTLEVSDQVIGDYFNDESFKTHFQTWLNGLWQAKDKRISQRLKS